jgi:hypothetical protein
MVDAGARIQVADSSQEDLVFGPEREAQQVLMFNLLFLSLSLMVFGL